MSINPTSCQPWLGTSPLFGRHHHTQLDTLNLSLPGEILHYIRFSKRSATPIGGHRVIQEMQGREKLVRPWRHKQVRLDKWA